MNHPTLLIKPTEYGLISIKGPEAKDFLQGQFSCDVDTVTPQHSTLGATCDLKGRIQSFFRLFFEDDCYYIRLPQSVLPSALAELKKYGALSNVEIQEATNDTVLNTDFLSDWDAIQSGIPEIYPETQGLFLPHYLTLPKLGAVSFAKGCYRGQEIVIRMEHKGNIKKTMKKIHLKDKPALGASIEQGKVVRFAENPNGGFEVLVETVI